MKSNRFIGILMLISLLAFAIFYFIALQIVGFGVMPYDEYYSIGEYNKTPCEAKQLDDGWTQLQNCVKYKINQEVFQRSKRIG